jgi:hypothetical protein
VRRTIILCVLVAARASRAEPGPPPEPPQLPPEPAPTWAEPPTAPPVAPPIPPPSPPVPSPSPPPAATDPELLSRLDELEQRIHDLERAQRIDDATTKRVDRLEPLARFITVFVDVGAFTVQGTGAGILQDIGHIYFPQFAGKIAGDWVFMGDPLATAINSLGEPADAANSREDSTDLLKSGGRPSLLVNSIGLSIARDVGHGVSIVSLVEFEPRPVQDVLDIELAHIDYRPTDRYNLLLEAGKIDSVLGIEYRAQDAPNRLGVTPSSLCRYTCGRPLGVEARLTMGALSTSAALTDGDNFQERFESDPTLSPNKLPTASGHVQWKLPVAQDLVLGVSGAYGPQDGFGSNFTAIQQLSLRQWHYGFDARLRDFGNFDITAEFLQGRQPGAADGDTACALAQCLSYKAAYILASAHVRSWWTPYLRVDWRSAFHESNVNPADVFVYESHDARATLGGHFEITSRIVGKIEYTYIRELDGIPQFPDNVLTSSIVVGTD